MKKISLQFIMLLVVTAFVSSCRGVDGEGDVVVRDKSVSQTFTGISLAVSGDVYIKQGNDANITVHGQQNIIDILDLDVNKNTLNIGFKKNNVKNYDRLKFYITTAAIEKLNISGSGKIIGNDSISVSVIDLNISGSGDIELNRLNASSRVKSNISGSGNITLSGSTNVNEAHISGSGSIYSFGLPCKIAEAHISGSGNIETTVSEKLDANISGSGNIRYKGRPVVNTNTSGSGKVTHVD